MKIFLMLVVLLPYIKLGLAIEINKVKVTEFSITYANRSILGNIETKVQKVNDTYNRIEMKFDILQDFPGKPFFIVVVYRSMNSSYGPDWERLGYYVTHLCDPNEKYLNYLPNVFKQSQGKKCFTKGKFDIKDAGIFEFWKLIPEEKLKKSYFLSANILGVGDQVFTVNSALSQSTDI